MALENKQRGFSTLQTAALLILRVAIGWHFLYEGISKVFAPDWSSQNYLLTSKWIFSEFFQWMAATPAALQIVDLLNMWGLIAIGLCLMLGWLARTASIAGIFLLLLYYLSNPPLVGLDFGVLREGNYLVVDKNLIELTALCLLATVPAKSLPGLHSPVGALRRKIVRAGKLPSEGVTSESRSALDRNIALNRREVVKGLAGVPFLLGFTLATLKKKKWESYEEKSLVDGFTSATIKRFDFTTLKDLKGQVPCGDLRGVKLSRLILGGNLIGGWAHARDLIYVSKLVKAYHHRDKVFDTFLLAEKCGINAILTNPTLCGIIQQYWRRDIGRIQFISDCGGEDVLERIKMSIDGGASACYVWGEAADQFVREGNTDRIAEALNLIRDNGLPAGIGAHRIETIRACVENGLKPDFWMKTLHPTSYWSARHPEEFDNIYCRRPEETIEFMATVEQPWIAFKTLAAGAVHPKEGFRYAFENGADFICVGMYDFQIVEDVNIALDTLNSQLKRIYPWRA